MGETIAVNRQVTCNVETHKMNVAFLETYYETSILPMYGSSINFIKILWKDHGKVGPDA